VLGLAADPVQVVRRQLAPGADQRARHVRHGARAGRDERRPRCPHRRDALEEVFACTHPGGVVAHKEAFHVAWVGRRGVRSRGSRRRARRRRCRLREHAVRIAPAPRLVRRQRAPRAVAAHRATRPLAPAAAGQDQVRRTPAGSSATTCAPPRCVKPLGERTPSGSTKVQPTTGHGSATAAAAAGAPAAAASLAAARSAAAPLPGGPPDAGGWPLPPPAGAGPVVVCTVPASTPASATGSSLIATPVADAGRAARPGWPGRRGEGRRARTSARRRRGGVASVRRRLRRRPRRRSKQAETLGGRQGLRRQRRPRPRSGAGRVRELASRSARRQGRRAEPRHSERGVRPRRRHTRWRGGGAHAKSDAVTPRGRATASAVRRQQRHRGRRHGRRTRRRRGHQGPRGRGRQPAHRSGMIRRCRWGCRGAPTVAAAAAAAARRRRRRSEKQRRHTRRRRHPATHLP